MTTKALLKTVYPLALLAVVLLVAKVDKSQSAVAPALEVPMAARSQAGSDWVERHSVDLNTETIAGSELESMSIGGSILAEERKVRLGSNSDFGFDWLERAPLTVNAAETYAGSDYIERHPSNYYTGSDYIERNSLVFSGMVAPSLAGSDWIERHPATANDYYAGSDFIERHPSNLEANSDRQVRHPWCGC